jgi:hypothetical protein
VVHATTTSIEGDEVKPVLCTLRSGTSDQCSLSLVFGYDVPVRPICNLQFIMIILNFYPVYLYPQVSFSVTGDSKGIVHLSGYFQPGPEDGEGEDDEDDDEDDEDDEVIIIS